MDVKMFDIYYADLRENKKESVQGGIRPVVIVQNNIGNKFSPTVLVLPLTSVIKKEDQPTHYVIRKSKTNGLKVDSMIIAEQLTVIDKKRLKDYIGHISSEKEQNEILNTYFANVTGHKKYDNVFTKVINIIFKFIREGNNNGNAA